MTRKSSKENVMSRINSNESSLSTEISVQNNSISVNRRAEWFYNIENSCRSSWIPFGDIDNQILEEAFSKNTKQLQLDNYLIDLDQFIRIDKQDSSIKRAIKRCISQFHQSPLRSERFYSPQKLVKSFTDKDTNDRRFVYTGSIIIIDPLTCTSEVGGA